MEKKYDKKRIKELVNFFYSSDSSDDVPVRIMISTGKWGLFDLYNESLNEFLIILNSSNNLKEDLLKFREKYE